jgi:choline dehydrogenase-like flavoprotein
VIINLKEQNFQAKTLSTAVCVIGGGAAGISMALAFDQMGIDVVLLEGGGLSYPQADELDLYDAVTGDKPYPVAGSRLRYLGGSTNHWGGWSRALDDFDLAHKPHFSEPGWPIDKQAIFEHYPKAAEICEIPHFEQCHNGHFQQHLHDGVIDWQASEFTNKFFVFSPPTRFGSRYRDDLHNSNHIQTYLHANATSLLFADQRITGVKAQSLDGHELTVEAEHTILAMGGLENPRFMLNNHNPQFSHGVGNHADWLGRGFMDHPGFQPIDLLLPTGLKYKRHLFEDQPVMPVLSMHDDALMQHQLNNFCVMLSRKKDDDTLDASYGQNPWLTQNHQSHGNYTAQFIFEPTPCKDSRVTLTNDQDLLGQRKLKLDWRFNDRDFRSVEQVVKLMIREFGIKELGRIKWKKMFEPKTIRAIGGGMHHAGTTKMSANPADGVVDEHCRVHDTEGLYVMGNSVFPHVGFSNPTITIVALALRLANHIKEQLA